MAYSGIYKPINPEKWIITKTGLAKGKIEYRSLWEKKFMIAMDNNKNVLEVASEPFAIQYFSTSQNKIRKYYPDFYIKMIDRNGKILQKIIEIKPYKETIPSTAKNKKRFIQESLTYQINKDKWQAAKKFCDKNNIEFKIMSEKELGIK